MTRAILISLLLSASAFGQFGFGVKGGAPLGDAFSVTENPLSLVTSGRSDYVIGPYVEVRLPFHFAIELDALTSTVNWQQTTDLFNSQTTARAWTFPLLAKYRFGHGGLLSPYVMAGASFGKLTSISQVTNFVTGTSTSTDTPVSLSSTGNTGFTFGGGLEFKFAFLRVAPEIRFTRWGTNNFAQGISNILRTNQNQGQFLIGLGF
jgi:opacity protein-like surface antigen